MAGKPRPRPRIYYAYEMPIRFVALTNGHFAIVDLEDYDLVMRYSWNACSGPRGEIYATSNVTLPDGHRTRLKMHRLILGLAYGDPREGDHVNPLLTLDNRRFNLRIATPQQNACNRKLFSNSTSGLKGVCWNKEKQLWVAHIRVNTKRIHLGQYHAKESAYAAYCDAARKLHGEFAMLA